MNSGANSLSQISRQIPLPLQTAGCAGCPLYQDKRCEGAITLESFAMQDDSVIGCRDIERIGIYYKDVKRTQRAVPPPNRNDQLVLPPFIPILTTGAPKDTRLDSNLLYGVSFSSILNKNGSLRYKTPESLRRALRLPTNGRLALFCTVDDIRMEYFWKISESKNLWQRVSALNFEFVTSATFSVYNKHPRSDQIINQARNFLTLDDLSALNVPAIPFIFFYPESELDYLNLLKELNKRPDVRKIAILAQLRRSKHEFALVIEYMQAIKNDIKRPLEFVVVGVAEAKRIELILSKFPGSTVASSQPFFKGNKCGEETLSRLGHKGNDRLTRAQLIENNISVFTNYCKNVVDINVD
ncbi:MAG TPA: hypothetical protein VF602_02800 [Pedobacter sp.]|jgi:hypothetical protein